MTHILLNKPVGLTPQQAIESYRRLNSNLASIKLGTVGRLDPMAEGLLVVMVGDENKNQARYLKLDKDYEVEFLLGMATDSYDLLGMPTQGLAKIDSVDSEILDSILNGLTGDILQPYPPFSAVRVKSRPLYWWARQDRLDEIKIPVAKRTIYNIDLVAMKPMPTSQLKTELNQRISLVAGDFRQEPILAAWNDLFSEADERELWQVTMNVSCSSGTFVRGLVNQIGQALGTGAVTKSIVRTSVGHWELKDAEHLTSAKK